MMKAEFGSTQPAPNTRAFKDLSTGLDGTESYLWEFGDGITSRERNPVKQYQQPSPPAGYNVKLTVVQGSMGSSAISTKQHAVGVTGPSAPVDVSIVAPKGMVFSLNGVVSTAT